MAAEGSSGGDVGAAAEPHDTAPRSALETLLMTASPQLMTSYDIARAPTSTAAAAPPTATPPQQTRAHRSDVTGGKEGEGDGTSKFTVTYTTSGVAAKSTRVHNVPRPAGITVRSPFAFSKHNSDENEEEDRSRGDVSWGERVDDTTPREPSALLFLSPFAQAALHNRGAAVASSGAPRDGHLQRRERRAEPQPTHRAGDIRTASDEEEEEEGEWEEEAARAELEPVTSRSLRSEVELARHAAAAASRAPMTSGAVAEDNEEDDDEEDNSEDEAKRYTAREVRLRVAQAVEARRAAEAAVVRAEMGQMRARCEAALHERDELAARLTDVVQQCEKMQRAMRQRRRGTATAHVSFAEREDANDATEAKKEKMSCEEPHTEAQGGRAQPSEAELAAIQQQMKELAGNMNEMEAALHERDARIAALRQSLAAAERSAADAAAQKEAAAACRVRELEAALQRQTDQVRRRMHRLAGLEAEQRALKAATTLWMHTGQRAAEHEARVYHALLRLVREVDALGGRLRQVALPSAGARAEVRDRAAELDASDEEAIKWDSSMSMRGEADNEEDDGVGHDEMAGEEAAGLHTTGRHTAASLASLSETQSHAGSTLTAASAAAAESEAEKSAGLVRRVLQTRQAGTLRLVQQLRRRVGLIAQRSRQLAQAAASAAHAAPEKCSEAAATAGQTSAKAPRRPTAGRPLSLEQRCQSLTRRLERCAAEREACERRQAESEAALRAELQRRGELAAEELQRVRRAAMDEAQGTASRHEAELAALQQAHNAQRQAVEAQREREQQRCARLQEQVKSLTEAKAEAVQRSAELEKKVAALHVQLQGQRTRQLSRSARDSRETTAALDELAQLRRSLQLARVQDAEHQAEAQREQRALCEVRDGLRRRCAEAEAAAQEQRRRWDGLVQAAQLAREGELATLYVLLDLLDVQSEAQEDTSPTTITAAAAEQESCAAHGAHRVAKKEKEEEDDDANSTASWQTSPPPPPPAAAAVDTNAVDDASVSKGKAASTRPRRHRDADEDDESEAAYLRTTPRLKRLRRRVICAVQKVLRRAMQAERAVAAATEERTHVPPCLSCPQQEGHGLAQSAVGRAAAARVSPSPRQTVLAWPVKASPSPPPLCAARPALADQSRGSTVVQRLCRASSFSGSRSLAGLSPSSARNETYYGGAGDLDGSGRPAPPPLLRCMSAHH